MYKIAKYQYTQWENRAENLLELLSVLRDHMAIVAD